MAERLTAGDIAIGVVGLGLMGSSITVSLLRSGHLVVAIASVAGEKEIAPQRVMEQLKLCETDGLLEAPLKLYLEALTVSEDYSLLERCDLVLECVVEKIEVKELVYRKITSVVYPDTIIATNTSAIPISDLQERVLFPERFIGVHWAEPAFATRFMEIICGDRTSPAIAEKMRSLALLWGKEPTLLRKDIRGFITNRLMYSVYREAFHLMESCVATMEDLDKAFRYDEGSWMTLMGLFRRMDFMGLQDCEAAFERLLPLLCDSGEVPEVMEQVVSERASGTQGLKGLHAYTRDEARRWEEAFAQFNKDIFDLARQYPEVLAALTSKSKAGLRRM